MKFKNWMAGLFAFVFIFIGSSAQAQFLDRKAMTLAEAKKAVAAGVEEAKKNGWSVVVVVVDDAGAVLSLERMDNAQRPSVEIAIGKAKTAALFRRPSGVLEEAIAKGRTALLSASGYVFMQGGVPIVINGETIGAVGVSGVQSFQDEQVAKAGVAVVGK